MSKAQRQEDFANTKTCPLCNSALKRCMIDFGKAVEICPVLTCAYPFNRDEIDSLVSTVSDDEVFRNVANRMKKANMDSNAISKLSQY